jgi:hypothetical protein
LKSLNKYNLQSLIDCDPANAAPAAPLINAAAFSKSPCVGGYTAGTLGAMMHESHCFWQASDSVCSTVLTVTLSKKKNRASRGFFVVMFTTNLKMIWKQTTNKQMYSGFI